MKLAHTALVSLTLLDAGSSWAYRLRVGPVVLWLGKGPLVPGGVRVGAFGVAVWVRRQREARP